MILVVTLLIAATIILLAVVNRNKDVTAGGFAISLMAPSQNVVTRTLRFLSATWRHYFRLVSIVQENERLKKELDHTTTRIDQQKELAYSNTRLRRLLKFKKGLARRFVSAEVVAQDPSPWYKTIIIDKGRADGIVKGLPVVVSEGVVGQIMSASDHYAKVLLLLDRNSAADALIQGMRARGVIQGSGTNQLRLAYVVRKQDVKIGDRVISSGLDGVYPKGLTIGHVLIVASRQAGIFHAISVTPAVDFGKLEEVLVLQTPVTIVPLELR